MPAPPTYFELLRAATERTPGAEALVFPDERLTYAELLDRAVLRARELRALGVRRGDTFGILMPNCPALVELLLGGALLGAAAVPVNIRFRTHELRHVITNGRLAAIVTTDAVDEHVDFKELLYATLPGLREAPDPLRLSLADAPGLRAVALVTPSAAAGMVDGPALRTFAGSEPAPAEDDGPAPDDAVLVMYTSGTTANPKGCVLSHRALVLNAEAIAERFGVAADDVWWDPLPMFHMGAILLMSAVFARGGAFVSMQHFDADVAFEQFARERITVLYPLFPPVTLALMHDPRFAGLLPERRRIVCSVAPPDLQRQIQDAFAPAVLVNAYGATELCGTLSYSEIGDTIEERIETCGRPLPSFEARIVDGETGKELPPGERGELVARGPSRFTGYFGDPAQTGAAIDADGFFHTGDLCSIDADGRLSYHGRLKDMLKVGGENVAALEVESFLCTHPAVKLAQVVGVPDDRLTEVVAAFVELAPGAALSGEEVVAFCTGSIASFKVPRHVRFVTEWPMSATKVQKYRLREQLVEELAAIAR